MSEGGYRGAGGQPAPYDPNYRVRPCDECGAGLLVGDLETTISCDCGNQQAVPAVRLLAIPPSEEGDAGQRLAHLRSQVDHRWLTPESVARFAGNVLEEEIPEAHAFWANLRKQLEADPEDADKALELMCVAFELHAALRTITREQQLARRAVAEATSEANVDPALRQKNLYNLVAGAVRAGDADHGRKWLEHMDPYSRNLDADSSYRISAAFVATAKGNFAEVLELPGRSNDSVPIHESSRSMAGALRANALEQLGSVNEAAAVLYALMRKRHSALALVKNTAEAMPQNWHFCARTIPAAIELDQGRLAANVPQGSTCQMSAAAMSAIGSVVFAMVSEGWEQIAGTIWKSLAKICPAAKPDTAPA